MQLKETRQMPMTIVVDESDTDDLDVEIVDQTDVVVVEVAEDDQLVVALEDDQPREEQPKPQVVVDVVEVDNPEYVSYNQDLRAMMRSFVEDHLGIPSITYETFHAYITQIVEVIYANQQAKKTPREIQMRFLVGYVDKVLSGFMLVTMLPQRMPHISTLQITYVYSDDIHLTAQFMTKVAQYKKLWRAKHISCIAVNDRVRHALERTLTGCKVCGYYIYGYSPKHKAVEHFVNAL